MTRPDVLVIGENQFEFHRLAERSAAFERILSGADVAVTVSTDRDLLRPERIGAYDVVVDYLTESSFTDAQQSGLVEFVHDGGGYVGVHCAADVSSFVDPPNERHARLLGGRFVDHPEQSTVRVEIVDASHPITAGVESFSVFDEPYDLRWDDSVHVLARTDHPVIGAVPAAWTRDAGDGRVFYCSLGHTAEAFECESFRTLLRRGTRWVARAI
jgi:hypothetical protein